MKHLFSEILAKIRVIFLGNTRIFANSDQPDVDGFAVVDWLRHHNYLHQVPLVVYSAKDLTKADCERLNLGQTLFLTKARVTPEEFEQRALGLLNCIVSGKKGRAP